MSLKGRSLIAAAGMARPDRFFAMLRAADLAFDELPLPDHFDYAELPWPRDAADVIVTEKDAVKLDPSRMGPTRVWVAALDFVPANGFDADVMRWLELPAATHLIDPWKRDCSTCWSVRSARARFSMRGRRCRISHELVCPADRLAFPVRDGIPVMLEAEARSLDPAPPAATRTLTWPTCGTGRSRQVAGASHRNRLTFDVLIPARLASTRLPGKPLADLGGVPMVVRVAQRAALSAARRVVVAGDHPDIVAACEANGVAAVLTRDTHLSGSDRLAEACELLGLAGDDVVVNVQGDEPLIEPALIDGCARLLASRTDCVMSTAAHPIASAAEFSIRTSSRSCSTPTRVRLYFSRAGIPHRRDRPVAPDSAPTIAALRHVGLYAYRAGFLRSFPLLPQSPLETIEALEQLRVLWNGERIAVHVSDDGARHRRRHARRSRARSRDVRLTVGVLPDRPREGRSRRCLYYSGD